MSSMNKVILVGNVGSVEVKEYEKGGEKKPLVQVSLATSDGYKDKSGNWHNTTEWHKCIFAIPSLAERATKIQKGDTIGLEGSIKTSKWTGKDGNEHSYKEIAVTTFKTWRKSKSEATHAPQEGIPRQVLEEDIPNEIEAKDDLPF